jgi:DNA-binding CsgD family transcriptional regulator
MFRNHANAKPISVSQLNDLLLQVIADHKCIVRGLGSVVHAQVNGQVPSMGQLETYVVPSRAEIIEARREEVARLTEEGKTPAEIAEELDVSKATVYLDLGSLEFEKDAAAADEEERIWRLADYFKGDYELDLRTRTPVWCPKCTKKLTAGTLILAKP